MGLSLNSPALLEASARLGAAAIATLAGPPMTTGAFLRGDANADDRLDITDPIFLLIHLFSTGAAPACMKSADTDDSGVLDLSDSVRSLNHLFLGGPPPSAPFPRCGLDSTADALTCEEYAPCDG